MKKYLFVFTLFVAAFGLTSCSSDDDYKEVAGVWKLIGHGSDEQFVNLEDLLMARNIQNRGINLTEDGRFKSVIVNANSGTYKYSPDGSFSMSGQTDLTRLGTTNEDLRLIDDLFARCSLKGASVSEDLLRLYYSDTEYVMFKRGGVNIPID